MLPSSDVRNTSAFAAPPALDLDGAEPSDDGGAGNDPLALYLDDIRDLSLLDAKQEIALARQIDALEVEHWRALLSRRETVDVVAAAVERVLPGRARVLNDVRRTGRVVRDRRGRRAFSRTTGRARALNQTAQRLQRLDKDGRALHATDLAVRDACAGVLAARAQLERIARARQAQQRVKERFVTANLRLVIAMARRYDRKRLPLADLIQEGNIGLMRAVERFDHRRGHRFSTYASWWIRHSLNRALSDKGRLVRVPVHALYEMSQIARAVDTEAVKTGTALAADGIALRTGLAQDKVEMLVAGWNREPLSLDRTLGNDRVQTLYDVLSDPEPPDPDASIDSDRWSTELRRLLAHLSPIETAVLRYRFGLDGAEALTLREIGDKYELSRERIRQIQQEALIKLRRIARRDTKAVSN
jgi:RNA polymerase primary sigma factor